MYDNSLSITAHKTVLSVSDQKEKSTILQIIQTAHHSLINGNINKKPRHISLNYSHYSAMFSNRQ